MKRARSLAPVAAALPAAVQAQPVFKRAPVNETEADGGAALDLAFADHAWVIAVGQFLANSYGFLVVGLVLGVVLLALLSARGSGREPKAQSDRGRGEEFFEPDDASRFGDSR